MRNNEEDLLSKLIKKWVNNLLDSKNNDEILVIANATIETGKTIFNDLKERRNINQNQITYVSTYLKNNYMGKIKNLILLCNYDNFENIPTTLGFQKLMNRKLLFVPNESYFLNSMSKHKNSLDNIFIDKKERHLYYMEKLSPLDIVLNYDMPERSSFIMERVKQTKIFWKKQNAWDRVDYDMEAFDVRIHADLWLLEDSRLLRSRLAVLIYRLSTLNLNASVTEVGRYFHKALGKKSKVYNFKLIEKYEQVSKLELGDDVHNKNFRAYDLKTNELETNIRYEIAKKLVNLKKCNLDTETISEVTALPVDKIKKMTR